METKEITIAEIWDSELYKIIDGQTTNYVSSNADEEITGYCWDEFSIILKNTRFSKNERYNKGIKFLLKLHALGLTDKEICEAFEKYSCMRLTMESIRKARQRAIEVIKSKYGKNLGIITALKEAFKSDYTPSIKDLLD